MVEKFQSVGEKIGEMILRIPLPDGSVFSTEKLAAGNLKLILTSPSGNKVDLTTYVEGARFYASPDFAAYLVEPPQIDFPLKELEFHPRNIFFLLHEMGHIRAARNRGGMDGDYRNAIVKASRTIFENKSVEDHQLILQSERDAWAEALYLARDIAHNGIDLFAIFKNRDEFTGWLRALSLREYEHHAEKSGTKAFTRNNCVIQWLETVSNGETTLSAMDLDFLKTWSEA